MNLTEIQKLLKSTNHFFQNTLIKMRTPYKKELD